jgi:hypothetical protein
VFVTVDLKGEHSDPVVSFFGVKEDAAPAIVGFDMKTNKKYKLGEKPAEKSVKTFTQGLIDGKLTPEYKSAAIPEEPLDGGVSVRGRARAGGRGGVPAAGLRPRRPPARRPAARRPDDTLLTHLPNHPPGPPRPRPLQIVVGKSFDKIVKDVKKDVLLEVYAPWCGHCKQLDPIYKKLAKRFSKVGRRLASREAGGCMGAAAAAGGARRGAGRRALRFTARPGTANSGTPPSPQPHPNPPPNARSRTS